MENSYLNGTSLFLIQQVPMGDLIEIILYVIGSAFSLILLSLSISAYRKNPQKRLLHTITAFSLFGVFLTYENFEYALTFENPFADITIPASTLCILVLFFLALTKKKLTDLYSTAAVHLFY